MKQFEVNCVTRLNPNSTHEQITHIGHSTRQWRLTREAAIIRIESRTEAYYTVDGSTGKRAYIGVVREKGKPPYLRTYADGEWNDYLLAQADCGPDCRTISW